MTKLGLLLLVLGLAGCAGAAPEPPVAEKAPPPVSIAQGIDMANDARNVATELKGNRVDFVARYYRNPTSHLPSLSPDEARALAAAGVKLVTVWESYSHLPAYFSYSRGYYDGGWAYHQAKLIGQPVDSGIYFAVDFNARTADITGPIDQYFRGIKAGFAAAAGGRAPAYRIGVYGSGAVCQYLKSNGLAHYAWLSNAPSWAGYGSFADWDIRQGGRLPLLSFSQDSNVARGDYGGFRLATQYSSL